MVIESVNKETRLEIMLRTVRLDSVADLFAQIDAARLAFTETFQQTHERVDGKRKPLNKRRKIAKYKAITARIFSENVDIRQDAINQARAIDKNA